MSTPTPHFTDGRLHEHESGAYAEIDEPFASNPVTPDIYTRVLTRKFLVHPGRYIPKFPTLNNNRNLVESSEALSAPYWDLTDPVAIGVADNVTRNCFDGNYTFAILFALAVGGTQHAWGKTAIVIGAGGGYSFSCFIRSGRLQLLVSDAAITNGFYANFDANGGIITKGATGIGAASEFSCAMTKVYAPRFGPYYRISISGKINAGVVSARLTGSLLNDPASVAPAVFFGAGETCYVGGVQFEAGLFPNQSSPYMATTSAGRSSTQIPNVDAFDNPTAPDADPLAFFAEESRIVRQSTRRGVVTRTYARVPSTQRIPSSKPFVRPLLDDITTGTAWAVSFDDLKRYSWIYTSRITINSVGAPPSPTDSTTGTVSRGGTIASSGTNPVTVKESYARDTLTSSEQVLLSATTAFTIFGSSTAAAIKAAAITAGLTGVECSRDDYTITLSWTGGTFATAEKTAGSCTVAQSSGQLVIERIQTTDHADTTAIPTNSSTAALTDTNFLTRTYNPPVSLRIIVAASHGGSVGDRVVLWNKDKVVIRSIVQTVIDANTFTIPLTDLPGKDDVVNHCGFAPDAAMCVVNGLKDCDTQDVTEFYLPGLALGITTVDDIPLQDVQTDPVNYLTAILAGTAWIVESTQAKKSWHGPIWAYGYTLLSLFDAIVSVTPF